ncbi:MAG: hypothetical protein N2115_06220 [bacterium]|nr:hypothetical protein [bacterium]
MKKPLIFLVLIALIAVNCGTVIMSAPPREDVKLLSEADPTAFKTTMKCWYVLWGLVPISNNSTAEVIAKYQLKNVRAKTYYSFVDYLINMVLGTFSIYTNTTVIEGNVAK